MKEKVAVLALAVILCGCNSGSDTKVSEPWRDGNSWPGQEGYGGMVPAVQSTGSDEQVSTPLDMSEAPEGLKVVSQTGLWKLIKVEKAEPVTETVPGKDPVTYESPYIVRLTFASHQSAVGESTAVLETNGQKIRCEVYGAGGTSGPGSLVTSELHIGVFRGMTDAMKDGRFTLTVPQPGSNVVRQTVVKFSGLKPERAEPYSPAQVIQNQAYSHGEKLTVWTEKEDLGQDGPSMVLRLKAEGLQAGRTYAASKGVVESTWTKPKNPQFDGDLLVTDGGSSMGWRLLDDMSFAKDAKVAVKLMSRKTSDTFHVKISGVKVVSKKGNVAGLDFSEAVITGDSKGPKFSLPEPRVVDLNSFTGLVQFPGLDLKKNPGLVLRGDSSLSRRIAWFETRQDGFWARVGVPVKEPLTFDLTNDQTWDQEEVKTFVIPVKAK